MTLHTNVASLSDYGKPQRRIFPPKGYTDPALVSRIFRAGSKTKNRALLHKGFRKPKSGARINKDTNDPAKIRLKKC